MEEFKKAFARHLHKFPTIPFLFIGSGFSRRYLALETWNELLKNVCSFVGLPKPYQYYYSKGNGDLTLVAAKMAEEFYEIWWADSKFADSRLAFQDKAKTQGSPLKYEICRYIKLRTTGAAEAYSDELSILSKINVGGIITTNWDNFLEVVFPNFNTYIGQEELLFFDKIAIGDIFKIHGGVNDPNSLVLTTEDYKNFVEKYPYLAAKLLTIFVEQPVIFIGYSVGDENIQGILKSIVKCLSKDNIDKLKDRLIFVQWERGIEKPMLEDGQIHIGDSIIPTKNVKVDSFVPFYEVLAEAKNKLPVHILKSMQNMVYDFVKSADSKGNVFVIDDWDKIADGRPVEFVYGIGIKDKLAAFGLKGITAVDLLNDAVEDKGWEAMNIASIVLPGVSKGASYLPYFKYLRKGGYLKDGNNVVNDAVFEQDFIDKVNAIDASYFLPDQSYQRKREWVNSTYATLADLLEASKPLHCCIYPILLSEDKIDLDVLEVYLKKYKAMIQGPNSTLFRKLICYYDYLKYKVQLGVRQPEPVEV